MVWYYLPFLFILLLDIIMKKSEYMQDWEKFYKIFWKNLNDYSEIRPTGDLIFNIIKFEELLIEKWYDEDWNKSMKDFIEEKYWTDAQKFVEHLLD